MGPRQHSSRQAGFRENQSCCHIHQRNVQWCALPTSPGLIHVLFFLILCMTPSSLFTTPPRTLQLWLLPWLLVSAPPVAHRAISLPSSLLAFSVVLRTSHTYALRVGISFAILMDSSLLTSSEIFLFFAFSGHKDGGCWSVLGPLVEQVCKSNLMLTSLTSNSIRVGGLGTESSYLNIHPRAEVQLDVILLFQG